VIVLTPKLLPLLKRLNEAMGVGVLHRNPHYESDCLRSQEFFRHPQFADADVHPEVRKINLSFGWGIIPMHDSAVPVPELPSCQFIRHGTADYRMHYSGDRADARIENDEIVGSSSQAVSRAAATNQGVLCVCFSKH
jgi:hypothetical protein